MSNHPTFIIYGWMNGDDDPKKRIVLGEYWCTKAFADALIHFLDDGFKGSHLQVTNQNNVHHSLCGSVMCPFVSTRAWAWQKVEWCKFDPSWYVHERLNDHHPWRYSK